MSDSEKSRDSSEKKPAWQTGATYAYRLALLAGLAWLGFSTFRSLQTLLGGPQVEMTTADVAEAISVQPEPTADIGPPEGSWLLAGLPWQVKSRQLALLDVNSQLTADPSVTTLVEAEQNLSDQPSEPSLAQLAASMLPLVRRSGEISVRAVEQPGFKLAVFLKRIDARDEILAARLALPNEHGQWSLVEFIPSADSAEIAKIGEGLLPLPETAQSVARRCDAQQRDWCQVALVTGGLSDLREQWQAAGWQVTAQSDASDNATRFVCRQGNRAVLVRYLVNTTGGPNTVVMTRLAAPLEST